MFKSEKQFMLGVVRITANIRSRIQRFKAILRRYNQLLTVVGALIVFSTYVTKEWKREQLKDIVQSVEGARGTFDLLDGQNELSTRLSHLQSTLDLSLRGIHEPLVQDETLGGMKVHRINMDDASDDDVRDIARLNDSFYDNFRKLLKAVPNASDLEQVQAARNSLLEIRREHNTANIQFPLEVMASAHLDQLKAGVVVT
jgi:hypothetical protein